MSADLQLLQLLHATLLLDVVLVDRPLEEQDGLVVECGLGLKGHFGLEDQSSLPKLDFDYFNCIKDTYPLLLSLVESFCLHFTESSK